MEKKKSTGVPSTVKTIITVVLLLFGLWRPVVGLIGVIAMWFWTKWPKWVKLVVTIFFVSFLILFFLLTVVTLSYLIFLRPVEVKGIAMSPNYNNGMYLVTKVVRPKSDVVNRGDVIIFKPPMNPDYDYINRVVGLPGETVMLTAGEVYINGQKLNENKYLPFGTQTFGGDSLAEGQTINIPSGYYFALGDNRAHSSDSRSFGLIPEGNIISRVAFCYWNCAKK